MVCVEYVREFVYIHKLELINEIFVVLELSNINSVMGELSGEQDWNVPCSDDENYGVQGKVSIYFCWVQK